jgi:hypothetical protein
VWLFYFLFGHIFAAILVYLNHRFVFHGKLGRLPVLRKLRRLHTLHHAHAYGEHRNDYFEPTWVKASYYSLIIILGAFVGWSFAFGIGSFGALYAYRHKAIHNSDNSSKFFFHHKYHHTVNPKVNFSGIYPEVDFLFKTGHKTTPTESLHGK